MIVSTAAVVLPVLSLASGAAGAGNGIIGFGISMYPDLCCQSCHDSLSSLYLICTTFDHGDHGDDMPGMEMLRKRDDMGAMAMATGMTSDDCRANNTAWLQTMAYCIQQNCDTDGYPRDKQAECFSNQAVGRASTPSFRDSLPVTAPTVELAGDATWLNETSLVNSTVYYINHGTLSEFVRSEYLHTKYSVALIFTVLGICVASGLLAQATSIFPSLQRQLQTSKLWSALSQHLFLPALFGSRRLEPLPKNLGYVPGRTLSLFINAYIILNIMFSSVSFGSFQPNVWFLSQGFELCEYVGNRTGTLSLVNMSISILFAGRNNLLIALTGWNQTTFLTLHRWTARVATVQAVVHSIAYTLAYFEPGYEGAAAYAAKAAEPFYWWGIIATIALSLAAAFAFLPFRAHLYESFLVLHVVLVILVLVGCWYHLVPHFGFAYGYQVWLYICFGFWSADRLARIVRLVYYNRPAGSRAVVQAVPGCESVMQVTVFPRVAWGFGPAQHSFLYLPRLSWYKLWENHPFSVAGWTTPVVGLGGRTFSPAASNGEGKDEKEAAVVSKETRGHVGDGRLSIRFLIRAHSGMTSTLQRRLSASPSGTLELSVYTEGPYAGHRATLSPLYTADTVLCVAGGIGITHILGVVQEYRAQVARKSGAGGEGGRGAEATSRTAITAKRFVLAWSARERALVEFVRCEFLAQAADEGVECLFWCTDPAEVGKIAPAGGEADDTKPSPVETVVNSGRMDIASVLRNYAEAGHQTAVLVCAPGGMADAVTREAVKCIGDGLRVELVEEAFAW
ncbi:fcd1ed96-f99e-4d28-9e70-49d2afc1fed5 [Staphylotrichum tortipilum]|uniref:Fcd1ed96-f99e-4d28-9e70-49d2afc1fed5 n=1 Tax=Staphylotrichum tortipilum TaxID=2831512 RepID=A0AAN6MSH6_9PEZI|nr:fcd1ed96-f99e-4d28-9e70-49d2afc1fed5 [Staphylotrichum longicolle]